MSPEAALVLVLTKRSAASGDQNTGRESWCRKPLLTSQWRFVNTKYKCFRCELTSWPPRRKRGRCGTDSRQKRCILRRLWQGLKGPGKRGHNVADTLLLMMFLGLRKLGNICCGHKIRNIFCGHKICARNKWCPHGQTFVSATMCLQHYVFVCEGLKSPGKRRHIVADTKCFWTKSETFFVSRTQKLCPQQMLPAWANGETFVSATTCPQQSVLVCHGLKESRAESTVTWREEYRHFACKSRTEWIVRGHMLIPVF